MNMAVNPFETRWIKPAEVRFIPVGFKSICRLLKKLAAKGYRGEIVGPHGVGKSTLLQTLKRELTRQDISVTLLYARGPFPHTGPPQTITSLKPHITPNAVLLVDGFEQLSWWTRRQLKRQTAQAHSGLVVTTHQSQKLPELIKLQTTLQTVIELITQLQTDRSVQRLISEQDAKMLYQQFGNNVREILFACYDLYEQRKAKL